MSDAESPLELIAYHGSPKPAMPIVPSERRREWMTGVGRFASRCLPMVIANQAGWLILNTHAFSARWNGALDASGVTVDYDDGAPPQIPPAMSHFGLGVLTWTVPYLFRTPSGFNLLARGPANEPKDGIGPLEGLVETDWTTATFTMNWKFTRPDHDVRFEVDEPFCMLVPQRRGELERFTPSVRSLREDDELRRGAKRWAEGRHEVQVRKFLAEHGASDAADLRAWEKDYFKGRTPEGVPAPEHQGSLNLAPFADSE
jgi:hypothetical protein